MEGQERYGDDLEKHRKGEMNVGQMTEPERRTETTSAETGVNNSQLCSMRDMDTKLCDCGVKPKAMYSNCQVMRIMELERGLCDSEVGGRVGYAGSNTKNHTNNDGEKQLERDVADVARHSAVEGTRSPKSCGKGELHHCRTHMMGNDPLACKEADKAGDFSGCRINNKSGHSTGTTASQVVEDSSECMARQPKSGEMEGNLWPVEHEDQDDSLCECSCGEQLPDLSRLGISSAMDFMAHYPYEDCSSNEFVMMCDFAAAEETQLSLSYGDRVVLLSAETPDWWWVEHNGNCGYVPASHLHKINDEDDAEDDDPWQDKEYFGSYKTLKLHLEMLSDQPRTQTYRNVILQNSSALKGKRILDLGCGTGIISFFCAQLAQPDVVYAVEASDIAEQTSRLVEENGFSGIVKVIRQRAEELKLPSRVDVLVSEWMGTCLVFEFMLESVLLSRDLWLKESGIMWPSTASIHMVPCSAEKEYSTKVLFWDSAYGLDFKMLKSMAVQEFLAKPKPDYVLNPEDCLSEPCVLLNINMKTLKVEELERMSGPFAFHVKRDGILHGFTSWFSVQFQNIENQGHVELHTGPFNPLTHWKHTLFMLDEPIQIHRGDRVEGSAVFNRNPMWRRHLSVALNWSVTAESATTAHNVGCKVFPIWR
ncbi:protein arginine N-methyltransferase 2 isoform X1 [Rana temporaria]|uniref:protein arginine N-methyltransferase 2 isoform X1 n=1 Tax=Rana temporaria TaxID=8407 RepID=UPI001AAD0B95|nr:protein arginine N-methyltransferase 2 isoform X1 [Rana temporaria]